MNLPDEKELKEFDYWKVARPSHEPHGVQDTWENPLSKQLVSGNPRNWRLSGNQLTCDTDFGPLTQTIPSDHILIGEDDKHLPIFKKLVQ
jgi:hypothetical protein